MKRWIWILVASVATAICLIVMVMWPTAPSGPGSAMPVRTTPSQGPASTGLSYEEQYVASQQLIEANCGDCSGATRDGVERGITELRKALQSPDANEKQALALLADAYNTLAMAFLEPDSGEQKRILLQRKNLLQRILELTPDDPKALFELAETLEQPEDKIRIARRIIEFAPDDVNAHRLLGMLLLERGEQKEGLESLRQAYLHSVGRLRIDYGQDLVSALRKAGLVDEAGRIRTEVRKLEKDWLGKG